MKNIEEKILMADEFYRLITFPNIKEAVNEKILKIIEKRGQSENKITQTQITQTQEERTRKNSLRRIDDSFKKIMIVRDNIVPRYDEYGIYYIGMRDFLLMEDFLEAFWCIIDIERDEVKKNELARQKIDKLGTTILKLTKLVLKFVTLVYAIRLLIQALQ